MIFWDSSEASSRFRGSHKASGICQSGWITGGNEGQELCGIHPENNQYPQNSHYSSSVLATGLPVAVVTHLLHVNAIVQGH